MTTIYFVRHAEPDYTNHNDRERPLTQKGKEDRKLVTSYLGDENIDVVLSSPFKRAVDTVKEFADLFGHSIVTVDDFRERKVDSCWIEDFNTYTKRQWEYFDYKLSDGESLREVQKRDIDALKKVLREYRDKNIVIGSHGTALSTIINYFDPTYGFNDFPKIQSLMPWVVKLSFQEDSKIKQGFLTNTKVSILQENGIEGVKLIELKKINVFNIRKIRKAVGAIIINPENEYLLVHKAKMSDSKENNTEVDFWDFVKGGVKEKETTLDAIKREIYEETGIDNFIIQEVIADKIRFEFPKNLKEIIGYEEQETTMYFVKLNEKPIDLRCIDGEIDGYEFVNKDSVLERLSHLETKKFWNSLIN